MKAALKSGVEKGVLVQVKNSYKLSAEAKKKPTAPKKETTAKPKKAVTKKVSTIERLFVNLGCGFGNRF
jgi:histone H1/5